MIDLGKKIERMTQGNTKIGTKGTNFIYVMTYTKISKILLDCVAT